jgi:hypothetical protein
MLAVLVAPQLAVAIALQAVNQSYDPSPTPASAKATLLSVVNMVRNTSTTTHWITTPLATLFQAVGHHNPGLRATMVEVVQALSTATTTQSIAGAAGAAGAAATVSLPGNVAVLNIPGHSLSPTITSVSLHEYECGLVSTDPGQLGKR